MSKKNKAKAANLLYQRLQLALDSGEKVRIKASDRYYYGIPINLNDEFIELLVLLTPEDKAQADEFYEQVTWLIRLSSIVAIAYPAQCWSKDKLESLLPSEVVA